MQEIEPLALRQLIDAKTPLMLLDVRQPEEHAHVRLPDSTLIPVMELPERIAEIQALLAASPAEVVVYCRSGQRSQLAIEYLSGQGIKGLKNLRGGINAYAKEADTSLSPY